MGMNEVIHNQTELINLLLRFSDNLKIRYSDDDLKVSILIFSFIESQECSIKEFKNIVDNQLFYGFLIGPIHQEEDGCNTIYYLMSSRILILIKELSISSIEKHSSILIRI